MQMPVAVESIGVGGSEGQSQSHLAVSENAPLRAAALSGLWLSNSSRDMEEVLSGVLKITHHAYGQEKLSVNIAIYISLSLSLSISHTPQELQPLLRIKCESYDHSSSMYIL